MSTSNPSINPSRRALLTGKPPDFTARDRHFNAVAAERASRRAHLERLAPNATLQTHEGRQVRFYDDVIKGRTVVLSAMYSACERLCPPAMHNLIAARNLLGNLARKLNFVTITLTPLNDGPQQLRDYKQRYGIGADWTFLTGKPEQVDLLLDSLGYTPQRDSDDLLTHASMVRICEERMMRWGHVNALTSPQNIVRMVRFELA
jgi:protein SCO1/2